MNMQARQAYMQNQVNTVNKSELTLMLYNGCIKFIKQASMDIVNKDYEAKNENLKKAQNIIDELIITLDMQYELSHNLKALYEFIKEQLIRANFWLDQNSLEVSLSMVTELRDTWVEAIKLTKQQVRT